MSINEDKREFEFIEHPDSLNRHCPSIIKMWVFLEGSMDSIKLGADLTQVSDLGDFKYVLKKEFCEELKNTKLQNIVILNNNNVPYRPDIKLKSLTTNNSAGT